MDITLQRLDAAQKPLLAQLLELYSYEFSAYSGDDVSEYGYYGYGHLDNYWNEAGRYPYLIRVDGSIAGFALVCPHCHCRTETDAHSIGEFFVMLKYRRQGVGAQVAARLFDAHPGRWEVSYWNNNTPAAGFWQRVVAAYTGGSYRVCRTQDGLQTGLLFENGGAKAP